MFYTLNDIKYKIEKVKTLNKNDEKGKRILLRAAEEVQPLMKKRQWSVRLLSEFLPRSSGLVGMYIPHKKEINVRLRTTKSSNIYHYSHIIGTILHELTHIVYKDHDTNFKALLDELVNEYNELYTPKNNYSPGKTTGTPFSDKSFLKINPKRMAALAAERRLRQASLTKESIEILNYNDKKIMKDFQENILEGKDKPSKNRSRKVYTIHSKNILCYIHKDTNIIEIDDQVSINNTPNARLTENNKNAGSFKDQETVTSYHSKRGNGTNKNQDVENDAVILISDKKNGNRKKAITEIYDLTAIP